MKAWVLAPSVSMTLRWAGLSPGSIDDGRVEPGHDE
jgi:hypothetical protein